MEAHSTARKWGLQNQGLKKSDMRIVAKYLKNNAYVEELDISNNNVRCRSGTYTQKELQAVVGEGRNLISEGPACAQIGDEGAEFLAKALSRNTKLSVLHMHHCNVADKGVEALSKALKDNNTLKEINLSNNRISDHGAACLSQTVRPERAAG